MENLLFETDYYEVFINSEDQAYLGRAVVELKRKCGTLSDLTNAEWLDFGNVVKKYETLISNSFGATMFNWTCLMNNAYQRNPPDPQVHWHVRPRYDHKVIFEGMEFEDKEFGKHYNREAKLVIENTILQKLIKKIQNSV